MSKDTKKYVDTQVLQTEAYKRRQRELELYGAEGVKELAEKGNIKEAAMVISYDGMELFSKMFGNSMESAMTKVLNTRIGEITKQMEATLAEVVEARMMQMLEGFSEGMKKFAEEQANPKDIIPEKRMQELKDIIFGVDPKVFEDKPAFTVTHNDPISVELEDGCKLTAEEPKKEGHDTDILKRGDYVLPDSEGIELDPLTTDIDRKYGAGKEDLNTIYPYFIAILKKYEGKNVKSADITRMLRDFNIHMLNPSTVYKGLMKIDPSIDNVGFGIYKYEEKNFKPTV